MRAWQFRAGVPPRLALAPSLVVCLFLTLPRLEQCLVLAVRLVSLHLEVGALVLSLLLDHFRCIPKRAPIEATLTAARVVRVSFHLGEVRSAQGAEATRVPRYLKKEGNIARYTGDDKVTNDGAALE